MGCKLCKTNIRPGGGGAEREAYCLHSLEETSWETLCPLPAVRRDERYLGHFRFLGLVCVDCRLATVIDLSRG
jgi:hypothetical protein